MNLYCTSADLDRYLSESGLAFMADHAEDAQPDDRIFTDVIEQASQEIDLYILGSGKYAAEDTAGNTLLRHWCVVLACCFLTKRRGNPSPQSLESECARIMELLREIKMCKLNLPGVKRQGMGMPTFSNLKVDRRYKHEKVRVTKANSSPKETSLEEDVYQDWWGSWSER